LETKREKETESSEKKELKSKAIEEEEEKRYRQSTINHYIIVDTTYTATKKDANTTIIHLKIHT